MDDAIDTVLAEKRATLERKLGIITAAAGDTAGISFGKRVGEGTNIAVERLSQVAAHGHLQDVYVEVGRAQEKRAEGTYGRCDRCGDAIDPGRLDARPWSTVCIDCA